MPPGTNGTAVQDDPLDLGDLIPEMKQVTIRRDGQAVKLDAYVYATAPISVYALIAQAHDEYVAAMEDETTKDIHRDQAFCRYYSQVARALTNNRLTIDEADRLGGDYPRLKRMLAALDFPPPRPEPVEGEAPAAESTTEGSSPSSDSTTAATTPTG